MNVKVAFRELVDHSFYWYGGRDNTPSTLMTELVSSTNEVELNKIKEISTYKYKGYCLNVLNFGAGIYKVDVSKSQSAGG